MRILTIHNAIIALLCISQVVLLYQVFYTNGAVTERVRLGSGASAEWAREFFVGSDISTVEGEITSIEGNTITMLSDESTTQILLGTNTQVVSVHEPKGLGEIQQDLAAYNDRVRSLMQDPEANQQALKQLVLPLVRQTEVVESSELAIGMTITVQGVRSSDDNSIDALRIVIAGE